VSTTLIMSNTPCFDILLQQFEKKDHVHILAAIVSMVKNRRLPKHVVIQGPQPSGKSTLVQLITHMMDQDPTFIQHAGWFWGEALMDKVDKMDNPFPNWTVDRTYPEILTKNLSMMCQRPAVADDPEPHTMDHLHYLAPAKTEHLRQIDRKHQSSIGFYEWRSPLLVITSKELEWDETLFRVIHMKKIKEYDVAFLKNLLTETTFVRKKLGL
jgi:energy-coupling factor transporter ATP-binding protein EcfA2